LCCFFTPFSGFEEKRPALFLPFFSFSDQGWSSPPSTFFFFKFALSLLYIISIIVPLYYRVAWTFSFPLFLWGGFFWGFGFFFFFRGGGRCPSPAMEKNLVAAPSFTRPTRWRTAPLYEVTFFVSSRRRQKNILSPRPLRRDSDALVSLRPQRIKGFPFFLASISFLSPASQDVIVFSSVLPNEMTQ